MKGFSFLFLFGDAHQPAGPMAPYISKGAEMARAREL